MLRPFLLSLALAMPAFAADTVAATVNGETIRLAEVDAVLKRLAPATPLTNAQTKALRESVLDELVGEMLVRQYVNKNTKPADAKIIDEQMQVLAEAQKARGRTLADYCRETGFSEAQLRASFDAESRWRTLVESRTTEAEYRKYFEANRDAFEGVTVRVSHILVRPGSEGEVNAAKESLRVLKADIEAKRITFADAAKKHSLCASAKIGGELGLIRRKDGQIEEPLAAAAFALPVNGISEPIRTAAGLHLVTINERKPGKAITFEKCSDAVKEAHAEEARQSLAALLRKEGQVRITLP